MGGEECKVGYDSQDGGRGDKEWRTRGVTEKKDGHDLREIVGLKSKPRCSRGGSGSGGRQKGTKRSRKKAYAGKRGSRASAGKPFTGTVDKSRLGGGRKRAKAANARYKGRYSVLFPAS